MLREAVGRLLLHPLHLPLRKANSMGLLSTVLPDPSQLQLPQPLEKCQCRDLAPKTAQDMVFAKVTNAIVSQVSSALTLGYTNTICNLSLKNNLQQGTRVKDLMVYFGGVFLLGFIFGSFGVRHFIQKSMKNEYYRQSDLEEERAGES